MPDLPKFKPDGVTQNRVTRLTGWFTIGAAGAITAQAGVASSTSGGQQCGVTVAKAAGAGDYRLTLHRGYKRLIRGSADVSMPAVTTAPTIADGNVAFVQGAAAANFSGATPLAASGLGLSIQTCRSDTLAVANPTSGVTVSYDIEVADI